jgi:hypothetical protein
MKTAGCIQRIRVCYYSSKVKQIRASAAPGRQITQFNVKPAVGFTLPSAGLSPAPSVHAIQAQNGADAILLWGCLKEGVCSVRRFTGLNGCNDPSDAWIRKFWKF